jgi:hypothetical protein
MLRAFGELFEVPGPDEGAEVVVVRDSGQPDAIA